MGDPLRSLRTRIRPLTTDHRPLTLPMKRGKVRAPLARRPAIAENMTRRIQHVPCTKKVFMPAFELVSPFQPAGDQPQAIEKLVDGLRQGQTIRR